MTEEHLKRYTGGCLCGALRYEAHGEPTNMGHCYCADCRKASGSGFVPFMGFRSSAVRFTGQSRTFAWKTAGGRVAVRNYCPNCGSLVFGGRVGQDSSHTIYAGSLDDSSAFCPKIAIFVRGRPDWAIIAPNLTQFEGLPSHSPRDD